MLAAYAFIWRNAYPESREFKLELGFSTHRVQIYHE